MQLMRKDLYVFMYGKHQWERVMKKKSSVKKILSPLIFLIPVAGILTDTGVAGTVGLAVVVWGLIWLAPELLLKQKCKEVADGFKMEMPDFLDTTALLLEAGQPLWYAVENASEMGDTTLCKRIHNIFGRNAGMDAAGNPEILLQSLAEELKVPVISSAVSAIVQNSRKGEKNLADVLRLQSNICRQERKSIAEELGNKTSNMLLIPSGMVFVAILIMLFAPAIMQLSLI